ncbi:MAG: hypothetical protein JRH20_17350, partial [Deltaproteobacteria bacterium]|nr:hypothetical protein [Deltaproteobacteria bacterium]
MGFLKMLGAAMIALSLTPVAHSATCRTHLHTDTYFEAGSLIIPMSTTYQGSGDMVRAYGLAWHLLRHGIRVAWIINTTKIAHDGKDFTINGVAPVVQKLARSGNYRAMTNIGGVNTTIDYSGAPMVIPSSDADAALQIIHQGVLHDNPGYRFGWGHNNAFNGVAVHRSNVGFMAPVHRIVDSPPKPLALLQTAGWLDANVLAAAGLDFPGAGGTTANHGLIYDQITEADISNGELVLDTYKMLWVNGDGASSLTLSTSYDKIGAYQASGGGVLASGNAITALECPTCTSTQFLGTTGVVNLGGGHGSHQPPVQPGSPFTQVDDLEYHGLANEVKAFGPNSTYKACVTTLIVNGFNRALGAILDDASSGLVFYVGGRNYDSGGAWHKKAMQRTVINLLFLAADIEQEEHPSIYELTRSTPLVIDADDGSEHLTFQGTYDWPNRVKGVYFNPSNVAAWNFP